MDRENHFGLNPIAANNIFKKINNLQDKKIEPGKTGLPEVDSANKVSQLIYNDTLTGFENRRGLNRYKDNLKSEQFPLVIFTVDLDNLKKINDNPDPKIGGHTGGDKYILSFVKFTDELFPNDKKFRLGGDEFVIPVLNLDPKELETTCQKLEVFNEREKNPNRLEFTYALEIASSKEDFYDALKRADDKLVEAKKVKKTK